jgi:transposase
MGKRYTEEEKRHIQELSQQGYTDESIAQQLNRSINAIRNYRHRTNIKNKETQTIQQLKHQNQKLELVRIQLEQRIQILRETHQIEEDEFKKRLEKELMRLKDRKPELFFISGQEQLSKLTAQLGISLIRWLFK